MSDQINQLSDFIRKKGMNQSEFASRIKTTPQYLSRAMSKERLGKVIISKIKTAFPDDDLSFLDIRTDADNNPHSKNPNNILLKAVLSKLNLRNANKDLHEATNWDRGNISKMISNKMSVSDSFLDKLFVHYGLERKDFEVSDANNTINHDNYYKGEDNSDLGLEDINVKSYHHYETHQNKNSNQFIKLDNGQYLMTMPLAEAPVQGGIVDSFQDLEFLSELPQHSIIVDNPVQGRYLAFRVIEHSMDNGKVGSIPAGYIVAARELGREHWKSALKIKKFPEWVIYTTKNTYPLLKHIAAHDVEKGIITCRSYNEDKAQYGDFDLHLNDVVKLFNVVDVTRGSKYRDY